MSEGGVPPSATGRGTTTCASGASGRLWARGLGVTLHRTSLEAALASEQGLREGLERALRDGVERGFEGALPALPSGAECYLVGAGGQPAGLLAIERAHPEADAVTLHGVAIAPALRGHEYASRAVLVAERRLRREGVRRCYARAPRGNGRGVYFWLHAGYAPLRPQPACDDGTTWFCRGAPRRWRGS